MKISIFCKNFFDFLYKNLKKILCKILMIFFTIFLMIRKMSYYKVKVSTGGVQTRWLGCSFLMVYTNNAGRLGAGFNSVCLGTRWLGQNRGFCVPECYCESFCPTDQSCGLGCGVLITTTHSEYSFMRHKIFLYESSLTVTLPHSFFLSLCH